MKHSHYPLQYFRDKLPYNRERLVLYSLKDRQTGQILQRETSISMLHYFAENVYRQPAWITDSQDRIIERCEYGRFERWDSEVHQYVEVNA